MSEQTDRQGAPIAFSVCEFVDNYLCINHRMGHVQSTGHIQHLIKFLSTRGLVNVHDLISRHGILVVDSVAAEIDDLEASGQNWREGVRRPGAFIHSMIRNRAKREGDGS